MSQDNPNAEVAPAADYLRQRGFQAKVAVVLGSGLSEVVESFDPQESIGYEEIPGFPVSTVAGHAGRLVLARPSIDALVLQGRFHYYEGYPMALLTRPIHVLAALGVETLIVTNAAGGINPVFDPGNLVLIRDHINFMGSNPLIGWSDGGNRRFVDLADAYSPRLRDLARELAPADAVLHEGVLMAFTGPSYETPSEIRLARIAGADLASMSTVPEVIVARLHGIEVLGISCVTNVIATDDAEEPARVSHEEVVAASQRAARHLAALVRAVIGRLPNGSGAA